ncbi:MAG: NAD+ synthase [Polyangiales bacterium]
MTPATKSLRIAIAQIDPTVGDLVGNARRILAACAEAKARGARVVVLPELVVTGYPPRDLLNVSDFVRQADAALESIVRDVPEGLFVILGATRRCTLGPGSRALHDSIVAFERGTIQRECAKSLLPTYDVFDERRYFEPAPAGAQHVVDIDGVKVGLVVCEDLWNDHVLWGEKRLYREDPVANAVAQGAQIIVNVSASPFAHDKQATRRTIAHHASERWGVGVVYCNAVGGNDGLLFDGGSLVYAAGGRFVTELPFFEESVRVVDLPVGKEDITQSSPPPLVPMDLLHRALVMGVRDYARKTGMSRWLVGVSGGVDSALVATIGALALGPGAGAAFALPSRYSSDHSIADARALCERLAVPFAVVPIEPAHAAYEQILAPVLAPLGAASASDVTYENVQARARGAILMAYANRTNGLLLTTGNKSECSVGYCTLYGDTCGGLAVIADVWKQDVYALCRWLNAHVVDGAIPESTLTKPPSAELRPGQRDDQSLQPYDVLDPILRALVELELGVDEAARLTHQPVELVRSLALKLQRAEYKRKQFAPTLRVSARAWVGRDYPLANGWLP